MPAYTLLFMQISLFGKEVVHILNVYSQMFILMIFSCKKRVQKKEPSLKDSSSGDKNQSLRPQLAQ